MKIEILSKLVFILTSLIRLSRSVLPILYNWSNNATEVIFYEFKNILTNKTKAHTFKLRVWKKKYFSVSMYKELSLPLPACFAFVLTTIFQLIVR